MRKVVFVHDINNFISLQIQAIVRRLRLPLTPVDAHERGAALRLSLSHLLESQQ